MLPDDENQICQVTEVSGESLGTGRKMDSEDLRRQKCPAQGLLLAFPDHPSLPVGILVLPRVDSIMLVEEGFSVTSVDASDKMLKYALKERWNLRHEPAFDKWGRQLQPGPLGPATKDTVLSALAPLAPVVGGFVFLKGDSKIPKKGGLGTRTRY